MTYPSYEEIEKLRRDAERLRARTLADAVRRGLAWLSDHMPGRAGRTA